HGRRWCRGSLVTALGEPRLAGHAGVAPRPGGISRQSRLDHVGWRSITVNLAKRPIGKRCSPPYQSVLVFTIRDARAVTRSVLDRAGDTPGDDVFPPRAARVPASWRRTTTSGSVSLARVERHGPLYRRESIRAVTPDAV